MKIGIMQPYFMPYLGYWQLIAAVDRFVIYDDVQYMKGGYINRNSILEGDKAQWMTIPLQKASPNRLIHEIRLVESDAWKKKLLKRVGFVYARAPFFDDVFALFEEIVQNSETELSAFLRHSIEKTAAFLGIGTEIIPTSRRFGNRELERTERVIDIVRQCGGDTYINAAGGTALYDKQDFRNKGIDLHFLSMNQVRYPQFSAAFVGNLSILDVMMFNSRDALGTLLAEYSML
jgi:hypothetical protein